MRIAQKTHYLRGARRTRVSPTKCVHYTRDERTNAANAQKRSFRALVVVVE